MSVAGFELNCQVVCDECGIALLLTIPCSPDMLADGRYFARINEEALDIGYVKRRGDDICLACQKLTVKEGG